MTDNISTSIGSGNNGGSAATPRTSQKKKKLPPALMPEGYVKHDGWLYYNAGDKTTPKPEKVCSVFEVVAVMSDANEEGYGKVVEITKPSGTKKRLYFQNSTLMKGADGIISSLTHQGVQFEDSLLKTKQRLVSYLLCCKPKEKALSVHQGGWSVDGKYYVLGEKVFGQLPADSDHIIFEDLQSNHGFNISGTLEDWQLNVAKYCVGNSRFAFGVSAAFAGCLIRFIGSEGAGFHFVGNSSTGKSTILNVAGSVWGGGTKDYLKSWNATANNLEAIAPQFNNGYMGLDEMGQGIANDVAKVAYSLPNGTGRGRCDRSGKPLPPSRWQVVFGSSGECTVEEKLAEVGKKMMAGQAVRIVNIPADAGAGCGTLENLHGFANAAELARTLNQNAKQFYGAPIHVFLQKLVDNPRAVVDLKSYIDKFVTGLKEEIGQKIDGQVERVAYIFGLFAVSGYYATECGITGWDKESRDFVDSEAAQATKKCFMDWLQERGGVGNHELLAGLTQVTSYFDLEAHKNFEDKCLKDNPSVSILASQKRYGFIQLCGQDKEACYCMKPEVFRKEICKGFPHKEVLKELKERDVLLTDKGRTDKSIKVDGKNVRMIAIKVSIKELEL